MGVCVLFLNFLEHLHRAVVVWVPYTLSIPAELFYKSRIP